MKQAKRKFAMPDAFIIIFAIAILAAIATYFIPAGSYQREVVDGITRVVPGSFTKVPQFPTSIMSVFKAIPVGLKESSSIIFLILIIGGAISIYDKTNAINAGIAALIRKTKGKSTLLIISVGFIFGLMSSLGVASISVIVFIPIGIALAKKMKLDAITGIAVVYLGCYAGNVTGVLDPTILGLAQTLAEVPLLSGAIFRLICYLFFIAATLLYILYYAKKIEKDPRKSLLFGSEYEFKNEEEESQELFIFTRKQQLSIFIFIGFLGIFLYGAFNYHWGIAHLSAIFIMVSIVVAGLFKISPNDYVKIFIEGAQSLVYGALVVGMARAVVVILDEGHVLDSIVQASLIPLQGASHYVGAQLLYFVNLLFNLLVTSGTGQASIVMPIMVPIVDALELTRQTGVLIFKLGDGITNIIAPTSGVLMAVLAVGRVPWIKWVRFVFPLLLLWIILGMAFIFIATYIGYGPV